MKILIVYFNKPVFSKKFENAIEKTFGMPVISARKTFECKTKRKNQCNAENYLPFLEKIVFSSDADFVLGITSKDIYEKGYIAVYGVSAIEKKSAIVSFARLKSKIKKQFFERLLKESVHEIGHLVGLIHCSNDKCAMKCSLGIGDCDYKLAEFCGKCESELIKCLERM